MTDRYPDEEVHRTSYGNRGVVMTLEQILAEAKALSLDEQQVLCDALNAWLKTRSRPRTEAEFELHLKHQGLLSEIPPPITDASAYAERQSIRVTGKPLSETIIEERG
jgi:hypothetical protein